MWDRDKIQIALDVVEDDEIIATITTPIGVM